MKVSIITVTYNSASTLGDTIESVFGQNYKNIEYIIIDGKSSDSTVEIVKSYGNKITKFISEKDKGLYDAVNKGIKVASGDIIGLLHSDDIFNSNNVITEIVDAFKTHRIDSVYADLVYVKKNKVAQIVRSWKSGEFSKKKFNIGWMPPHPTFYVKRQIYEKYGMYDTNFKCAADYEIMLRFLYKYEISTHYIPKIFVRMRIGGESNKNIKNRLNANKEDYQAWIKNNLNPHYTLRFLKPLLKINQFNLKPQWI